MARINLLPAAAREKPRFDPRRFATTALVVLVLLSPLIYYGYSVTRISYYKNQAAAAKKEYATYADVLAKRKLLADREKLLTDKRGTITNLAGGVRYGAWLHELTQFMPQAVILKEIVASATGQVTLRGNSSRLDAIAQLIAGLNTSRYLEKADLSYAQPGERDTRDFEIVCFIRKAAPK